MTTRVALHKVAVTSIRILVKRQKNTPNCVSNMELNY